MDAASGMRSLGVRPWNSRTIVHTAVQTIVRTVVPCTIERLDGRSRHLQRGGTRERSAAPYPGERARSLTAHLKSSCRQETVGFALLVPAIRNMGAEGMWAKNPVPPW